MATIIYLKANIFGIVLFCRIRQEYVGYFEFYTTNLVILIILYGMCVWNYTVFDQDLAFNNNGVLCSHADRALGYRTYATIIAYFNVVVIYQNTYILRHSIQQIIL